MGFSFVEDMPVPLLREPSNTSADVREGFEHQQQHMVKEYLTRDMLD